MVFKHKVAVYGCKRLLSIRTVLAGVHKRRRVDACLGRHDVTQHVPVMRIDAATSAGHLHVLGVTCAHVVLVLALTHTLVVDHVVFVDVQDFNQTCDISARANDN